MNKQCCDILNALADESFATQRMLAERTGHSLGVTNRSIKELVDKGYLNDEMGLTPKAWAELETKSPKRAIILAAGFGMRMVPINTETPKGLLKIKGEVLIERTIRQLQEAGITEIYVVVGFMKEYFEYLIDEYGVELIVNRDYMRKNNLFSLNIAKDHLSNSYVIPCDIWCKNNPYRRHELYSWYMVSDAQNEESIVRVNRKMELVSVSENACGNTMIGISYLVGTQAEIVRERVTALCENPKNDEFFWEEALREKEKMILPARVVSASDVVEINTYEQLREFDGDSNQLKTDAIKNICDALHVPGRDITNISVLKKGMTNRSFLFDAGGKRYIMRIPGEGTDQLINRSQEAAVYQVVAGKQICDDIAYINPDNGYKITEFLEDARCCDPSDREDVKKCMKKLREFHEMGLSVDHTFDLFGQIEFYETLWGGKKSVYKDYEQTKERVFSLKSYIESQRPEKVLTHIDAVPDNFLFTHNEKGEEEIRLIDWEYAGMQDPHVDLAMFCVYSFYDKVQLDELIQLYFDGQCQWSTRIKIYCYVAVCGLLWSNWCEYKLQLGVEFGEYSLRQYRYAKEFYKIARREMENLSEEGRKDE